MSICQTQKIIAVTWNTTVTRLIHWETTESKAGQPIITVKTISVVVYEKKADRHSHHRRRKINREELINNGVEAIILGSTTCTQKRAGTHLPQNLSNRKGSTQSRMGKIGNLYMGRVGYKHTKQPWIKPFLLRKSMYHVNICNPYINLHSYSVFFVGYKRFFHVDPKDHNHHQVSDENKEILYLWRIHI